MSESVHDQIEAIFIGALEREGDDRVAFLGSACGTDVALRDCVLELIDAHDGPGGTLEPVGF